MIVYHGSLSIVKEPIIIPRQKGHTCDFEIGFYTTTSISQAERWVRIRKIEKEVNIGYINKYDIPNNIFNDQNLKTLYFDSANEEWLDFVFNNRRNINFTHEYDLVFGKVATDNVYTTINLFEDGFLDKEETIKRLRTYKLVDQILFHTKKSLPYLHFAGVETI